MGVATGHSASNADFKWSPARISVSSFWFSLGLSFGQFVGTKTVVRP